MSDGDTSRGATEPNDVEPNGGNGDNGELNVTAGRIVGGIIVALVIVGILILFIGRRAGFDDLSRTINDGDWRWLAVCACAQFVVFGGYAGVFRTSLGFEGGPRVPTGLSLRVIWTSFAMTQIVAAGGAGGLAVNYWALRQLGLNRREAVVRLLGLNTVVYLVFGSIAWVAALLTLLGLLAPLGLSLPWVVGIPVLFALAWWFTEARRVEAWSTPTGGPARKALSTGVSAAWWARRVSGSRSGRPVIGWAALYWIGDIASLWGALQAFGRSPGLVVLALVYVTSYLAEAIPIPFIATGGMDAALVFSLEFVGVPPELALVAVIAHRVFAFWIPIGPGIALGLMIRRTGAALGAVRERWREEQALAALAAAAQPGVLVPGDPESRHPDAAMRTTAPDPSGDHPPSAD